MTVIKDITKKRTISDNAKIAISFCDRLLGLLNPQNPRFLIIYTHFGVHTFFMKKPIDVLILNHKSRVIKLKSRLYPFKLLFYHPRFNTVIEMPEGTIKKYMININDKISIK